MEKENYESAKSHALRKKINIFSQGLLVHNTDLKKDKGQSNFFIWGPRNVIRFIKLGIKKPSSIQHGSGFFPSRVSFFLTCTSRQAIRIYGADNSSHLPDSNKVASFILDPSYVSKNRNHFYYNPLNDKNKEAITWASNYFNIARSLGFQEDKDNKLNQAKAINEIQSDISIPFDAICGIVLLIPKYENRMKLFLYHLSEQRPEWSIPLYSISGKVMWPE